MGKLLAKLKRVRFVYRRSNNMTKTVVISAIVLSMAALLTLHIAITAAEKRYEEQKKQAALLEQEKDKLNDNIGSLGSADSVDQIAKDELGMVDPDSVILTPNSPGNANNSGNPSGNEAHTLVWVLCGTAVVAIAVPVVALVIKRKSNHADNFQSPAAD